MTGRTPRGPEEHKAAARRMIVAGNAARAKHPAAEEIAVLGSENDPFYCGTPRQVRLAEWFVKLWAEHGGSGAHLRHVHYRVFTAGAARTNGSRYANNVMCYNELNSAAAYARYLGLVNAEELTDQRNDPPRIGVRPVWGREEPAVDVGDVQVEAVLPAISSDLGWFRADMPELATDITAGFDFETAGVTVSGYDYDPADQPALVEVWAEKSSVDDTMLPLCDALRINYLSGAGYESITQIIGLLRRAEKHYKPAHVLYVSDYDRAGRNMPRQAARQVQFWREELADVGVSLQPIALTAAQVAAYSLPQQPNDPERVELDALIALEPGALEQIIRDAVAEWRDPDLEDRLSAAAEQAEAAAEDQWAEDTADVRETIELIRAQAAEVVARHQERLDEVGEQAAEAVSPLQERLDQLAADINDALEPFRSQAAAIQSEAESELESLDEQLAEQQAAYEEIVSSFAVELPDRPEAECAADRSGLLYDSERGWLDQLNAFRASKGLPSLTDYHDGLCIHWQDVHQSLTSGNGSDGIEQLLGAEQYQVVAALVADGWKPAEIVRMTAAGIESSTAFRYCRKAKAAQRTGQQ